MLFFSIDMSGNTPVLSFLCSEPGTIDLSGVTSTETQALAFPTINRIVLTDLESGVDLSNCTVSITDAALNKSLPALISRFIVP